jgi:hypothetical protein
VPRRFVLRGSPLIVPFTLVWLAFALFWEVSVLSRPAPGFFALWGAIFVALGLYIAFGRFFVAWREADRTTYVLTDQRVLIVGGAFGRRSRELSLRTLPPPVLDQAANGVGTITFGQPFPQEAWLPAGWPMMGRSTPAFIAIENASNVFDRLDDAVSQARSST